MTVRAPALAALLLALAAPAAAQTIGEIQTRAAAGDRDSQFLLGEAYRTGQGVTPDRDIAISWFRKAAALGDARAADALGLLLFTKGERREAIPLLEAAETRADARALYLLGTARFNGDGVPKDLPRAYAEMRAAADKGLPQAIRSLQLMEPYISDQERVASQAIRPGVTPVATATVAPVVPTPAPLRPLPAPIATTPIPPSVPSETALAAPLAPAPAPAPTPEPASAPDPEPVFTARPAPAPAPVQTAASSAPLRTATASPTLQPARPPAPKPFSGTGRWRVQLGAIATRDKAEDHWRMLTKKTPQLAPLPHTITQAGALWRLQATGLASLSEAQTLCRQIVAKGGDCIALSPAP